MKQRWCAAILVFAIGAGSLYAQSGDRLPAEVSGLPAAFSRTLSGGIEPNQVGGCPSSPPAITLGVTVNSSIDGSSCSTVTVVGAIFFDSYSFSATSGQHLHVTYTSSALKPLIAFLTTSSD